LGREPLPELAPPAAARPSCPPQAAPLPEAVLLVGAFDAIQKKYLDPGDPENVFEMYTFR
jgi:hypothetical protein